jgi:hypothetical protein
MPAYLASIAAAVTPSTVATTSTDTGRECLAGDQRGSRRGGDHQLGEHAGVTFPDDLNPVEDGDEQRGLGKDARCEVGEIGDAARGGDGVDPAESLAEDDQPEGRLDGTGAELGAVMPDLPELDPAQRVTIRLASRRTTAAGSASWRYRRVSLLASTGGYRQTRPVQVTRA